MLPPVHRLTRSTEIARTIRRGRRAGSRLLVVHTLSTTEDGPAVAAFAVSRAVGNSVVRHRVTRRLRAALLPRLAGLPAGTQVVIRALPPAAGADFADLDRAVADGLRRSDRDGPADRRSELVPEPLAPPVTEPAPGGRRILRMLGSPLRWALLGLIQIYRWTISPILPPTCRFHPSCSAYAMGAIQTHGAAKGFVLAAWRLLRCNPWNLGGLDPVPEPGRWQPEVHPDGSARSCRTLHA